MKNKPALECSSFKAAELSQTQEFNMLFRDDNDWINFAKVRFPNQKKQLASLLPDSGNLMDF